MHLLLVRSVIGVSTRDVVWVVESNADTVIDELLSRLLGVRFHIVPSSGFEVVSMDNSLPVAPQRRAVVVQLRVHGVELVEPVH